MKNNPLETLLESIPSYLRNRYVLVLVPFLALMLFFDTNNIFVQWRLQKTVNELENEKTFYLEEIERAEEDRLELEIDKEKIAREKYYMKRPGEDVFIIVEGEEEQEQ